MIGRKRARASVSLLLLFGCAAPCAAAAPDGELRLRLGLGHDGNALRLHDAEQDGLYAELNLVGAVRGSFHRKLGWFVHGNATGRDYESDLSDADTISGRLRAGFDLTPNPHAYRRVSVAIGGLYNLSRSTFVDRATGRVYEVTSAPLTSPPTTEPIPDRFDADSAGGFVEVNWKLHDRMRVFLNTSLEDARYAKDYTEGTFLHPLDYRVTTFEPGLVVRVHRRVALGLSAVLSDLEYDQNPALDENGSEAPGTARHYEYTDLSLSVRIAASPRVNLEVGARGGTRDDTHAGYYDFDAQVAFVSVDYRPGPRTRLQLYASTRQLDYENAVVAGSVNGELRASDVARLIGRYEWRFHENLGLFGESGAQRTENSDPIYAYDRNWILTGMTFRR